MATGYIEPIMSAFERGGQGSFVLASLPQNERLLAHADVDPFYGDFSFQNPDPISQSYGGNREFAFLDDFYFRVYLIPQILDFGAIVTTVTREITVWNAYFTPVILQSITPFFGEEVVQGGPALPNSIPPLTIRAWEFTVTTEGPPTLEESYTWTFDTGEVFTLPVTGTRSVLWPFLPNWGTPFRYTLEYDTSVFTARSGREQRRADREHPRLSLEFDIIVHSDKLANYRRLMALWQDRPFIVSDISRNVTAETALLAGQNTVTVSDDPTWIGVEDRAVVLVTGSGEAQQVGSRVIDNIDTSNNLLTFKDTDTVDWPVGTKIYAVVVANLEDERTLQRHTTNIRSGSIRFKVLPGTELVEAPPLADEYFLDRELFLFKPNWGSQNDALDAHPTEYVDYGVGRLARFSPLAYPQQTWTQTYVGRDAEGIRELLDVFRRAKGRQGEFYMPTWENDLVPSVRLNGATLGMQIAGLDVLNAYGTDPTKQAVMVELVDGTRIFRAIDEVVVHPNEVDTLINMTQTWDDTIELEDIHQVSWLMCWRFSTDDLTAEFLTNSVANLSMSVSSLEDLPAESDEGSNSP